jgi:hypothetical protein
VYTHSFEPTKPGKLINAAPELFARTKAKLLAFAAFLERACDSSVAVFSSLFHMSHLLL